MSELNFDRDKYLGDGLYYHPEDDGFWLLAYDGIRVYNRVWLDSEMFKRLKREVEGEQAQT